MGCSLSKSQRPAVLSTIEKVDERKVSLLKSADSQPRRIVENCIILLLSDESSVNIDQVRAQLCSIVCTLKIFTDLDACITFVENTVDEKLFLIMPAAACQFIEQIRFLSQLEKTYIFDSFFHKTEEDDEQTLQSNIFRDSTRLCQQLQHDVELCEWDNVAIITVTESDKHTISFSNLTKQEASFIFAMLLKELAIRLKFDNEAKNEFVAFCRAHYAHNNEQLRTIDDFERNYRPHKALWWLTHPCFVARMLKRAQRTKEIDILYKLGFYVKHVYTQLTILHDTNLSQIQESSIVYRGKTMSNDEFDTLLRNNRGGLLSFAHFIEASIDMAVALDFVRRRLATHPEMIAVVFEIHIDPTIYSTKSPFALLDDESKKGVICFTVTTVFRIESIEETAYHSGIWIVKLTFVSEDDEHLLRLLEPLRNNDVQINPLSYLGILLISMGEYDRAEKFFLAMLRDASVLNQPHRLVRVHNGLGANYMHKGEHAKALKHYQKALDVSLSYLPSDHPDLSSIYNSIGSSHLKLGDYSQAVHNYQRAVALLERDRRLSNFQLIDSLHNQITSTTQLLEDRK